VHEEAEKEYLFKNLLVLPDSYTSYRPIARNEEGGREEEEKEEKEEEEEKRRLFSRNAACWLKNISISFTMRDGLTTGFPGTHAQQIRSAVGHFRRLQEDW
jgi:hypothetical protein